jgi:hypothetical protein
MQVASFTSHAISKGPQGLLEEILGRHGQARGDLSASPSPQCELPRYQYRSLKLIQDRVSHPATRNQPKYIAIA